MKRRILFVVCLVVFAVSGVRLASDLYGYHVGDEEYAQAETLVDLPEMAVTDTAGDAEAQPGEEEVDPYAEALANMDFKALQEVNADVLGWIVIPGTKVSYPLLQGKNNEYYLAHTYSGKKNLMGSIFLESGCSRRFDDFNTIIYGHNMQNKSMFSALNNYKEESYYRAHPKIYITTEAGSYVYEIFAAYQTPLDGACYYLNVESEKTKQKVIEYGQKMSWYDTGVVPEVGDRLVTLSTCTGNGHEKRTVVQGVLKLVPRQDAEGVKEEVPAETLPTEEETVPEEEVTSEPEQALDEGSYGPETGDAK